MSEQLQTNSSFFKPVPINPSARLIHSFSFASTTLVASIVSKLHLGHTWIVLAVFFFQHEPVAV